MALICNLFFPDAFYHDDECPHEYDDIEKDGIILDIVSIEEDLIFEGIALPTIYLCHACDPGLHREYLSICFVIEVDLARLMRTRSYERHIPYEYVP